MRASTRLLLCIYTALTVALFALTTFVPGVPFQSARTIGGTIIIDAVLLFFLWRRSPTAWWIAVSLDAIGIPLYVISTFSGTFNPKGVAALLLEAAAVFVLLQTQGFSPSRSTLFTSLLPALSRARTTK